MSLILREHEFRIPFAPPGTSVLGHLSRECANKLSEQRYPVRFVVTSSGPSGYACEVGVLEGVRPSQGWCDRSIFRFCRRPVEHTQEFNVVLVIPTGVGAEIGGHAGDAGPVARLLANVSDTLVLHPNVVNASDINEMPGNALYVEGSVLCRVLMGTAGLQRVRSNRLLVVVENHPDELFVNAAINTVSAARATYGLSCAEVVVLEPAIRLRARYSESGRAVGSVEGVGGICELLEDRSGTFDAVAVSTVIDVPREYHREYFDAAGEMVNPWGGVEAVLTHALSELYSVPAAHSPMFESREIANMETGIVDARMAAEAVSVTFLQCVLKGLQRSPRIVTDEAAVADSGVFTCADVSCLVIPDGCLGLPTLAALEQGIPVVAVAENRNLMTNDLTKLPWAPGQFHRADNYLEGAGIVAALRAGIEPNAVRRPLGETVVSRFSTSDSVAASSSLRVAK